MISRLPGLSLPERVWNTARRWAVAWWRILYMGAVVLVLVLSPSSYGKGTRRALARHLYLDTAPALRAHGSDPVRIELLPRVIAGVFACITLAALSCVVALVLAYLGVYGFNLAGLPSYTRMFGQVITPSPIQSWAAWPACLPCC